MRKNYYIYILASCKNGTLYIGITNNLKKRVYEHKNGLMEGFTKKYNINNLMSRNLLYSLYYYNVACFL